MRVDEIFELAKDLEPLNRSEILPISQATGKILASDIIASRSLPAFDNSALDGYAFAYADIDSPLKIKGVILAGDKNSYEISKNECYKIMTGAAFPKGSDSVVMIENESFDESGNLIVPPDTPKNNARKIKGEEIEAGELLLAKGSRLTPANIMLLAAQGISYINTFKNPRIAVFSSGNEINEPWSECDKLSIYNANSFGIISALSQNGFKSEYKGILKDEISYIKEAINSCSDYDIIITSGGASKGEADYMSEVLNSLDFKPLFSSIDARPAKPTKCYKNGNKLIFVLPGNPMSCLLATYIAVIPFVKRVANWSDYLPKTQIAKFKGSLKFKASRANIVIGTANNGEFRATNDNIYSPSMIRPISLSNSIYISNIGQSEICDNQEIKIYQIS
ncbi:MULTISPECIES: molybdopterin molybdotransferase MoeA [Campylobacter]|uniref:molybdopterin molybdotransferase MoeA n=1 Tax=Campylobacter TaxID=194 RepID=UPI000A35568A|nr:MULTISPECIES: molybdopterin molybdotransferase MoeA [unclassified Campylobacter]MCR8696906.1 molybdopterin molybdotransferase MoeA [Campylobacter sp. RM19073]